ncbi:MAG TPA: Do family serine endopeptidase [Pseudomonadota bacterium]|nr:Do family serine endopeptidase [Pseudomonadota bacterium]HNO68566.1 Do family serine endopeptidase [Pseudomonadota bacterium]
MTGKSTSFRLFRSLALFTTGALITVACTKVKVSWDQQASAAAPGAAAPAAVAPLLPQTQAPSLPPPTPSQIADARSLSRTFSQVAEQVSPSVVAIRVAKKQKIKVMRRGSPFGRELPFHFGPFGSPFGMPDDDGDDDGTEERQGPVQRGAGSGVVIDAKGYILTNNHVVGEADDIKVQFIDGKELPAKIVGTDSRSDLAVIRVDPKDYSLKAARLGDSEKLLVGEWVMAIGNPFGLDHTVTVGVISAKGRSGIGENRSNYQDFLQTDASINPGNSGGPLVNLSGEVIGINTAILGPGGNIGIGFAVPSDMAKPVVSELIASGKVHRPFLGITMQPYEPDLAKAMGGPEKGALVQGLTGGGPAEKAGVRRGDIITKVDGKAIANSREVQRQVLTHRVGDPVALEIWRDGKMVTISAKAGELPSDEAPAQSAGSTDDANSARAKLGLALQPLTPQLAERLGIKGGQGVVIGGVKPGSPAAEAGLHQGDVIAEVDRHPVKSVDEATKLLGQARPGGHVLLIQRGDSSVYILIRPSTP